MLSQSAAPSPERPRPAIGRTGQEPNGGKPPATVMETARIETKKSVAVRESREQFGFSSKRCNWTDPAADPEIPWFPVHRSGPAGPRTRESKETAFRVQLRKWLSMSN